MVKLGEVCDFYAGTVFPNEYQGKVTGKYPFYKVGDISKNVLEGNRELKTCANYVEEDVVQKLKGSILPPKTIVFAKIGEALKLNRRAITSCECLVDNNVMGIKTQNVRLNDEYLFYWLQNLNLSNYSESTTVPSVKKSRLQNIEINVSPLEEQEKVVSTLNRLSSLILARKKQLSKLDELVKARFVEMFGDDIYPKVKVSRVCDFITKGTTPPNNLISEKYSSDKVPYLKVYNLSFTGKLLFDTAPQYVPENIHNGVLARSKVYPNDVLMNIVGPPLGKFALVTNEFSEWNINQAIAIFRAKEKVNPKYLLFALMQPEVLKPFLRQAVGIRQLNLSLAQCRDLEIPLPPLSLQSEFAAFVEQVDQQKQTVQQSLEKLELMKKALMQEYFG